MTFLISADDLSPVSQVDRSTQELRLDDPQQGKVYRCETDLCNGLSILIDDYQLTDDLLIQHPASSATNSVELELSFSLLGTNHAERVRPGQNFFSACQSSIEASTSQWHKGDRVLKFDIHFNLDFLQQLLGNDLETLPPALSEALQQSDEREFWHLSKTTPTTMPSPLVLLCRVWCGQSRR